MPADEDTPRRRRVLGKDRMEGFSDGVYGQSPEMARPRVVGPAEVAVEAEWTQHLGKQGANQLRRALTRLRQITDPYW